MHEGEVSARLGLAGIPSISESTMIARDAAIARYEDGRIHIQHLSARESVEAVAEAKARGVRITCEASPHHLTLTDESLLEKLDTRLKMNPPLRTEDDRQALIEGLRDGTIDCIATDHAPHAREEKEVPFEEAPMGTTGLETAFAAVYTATGARKRWVLACSVPYVLGCAGFWLATPGMPDPGIVLVAYVLAFLGSEFGVVFTNAMLPGLGPRREIGRISGSGWALGYLGGLVSLVVVLLLLAPAPGGTRTLLGIEPIFGLDVAAGEPARATGPLSAIWYVVFALPLFLWTPDEPARRTPGLLRAGIVDLVATFRLATRNRSFFAFMIASMVYRDALAALFAFGGIYAAGVLGWGLFQLGIFGIVAAGVGTLGAWLGGRADRAFGRAR